AVFAHEPVSHRAFRFEQGTADEDLRGRRSVHTTIVHLPAPDLESVNQHTLRNHHAPALFLPPRLTETVLAEVRCDALNPERVDASHGASEQLRGLYNFARDDPLRLPALFTVLLWIALTFGVPFVKVRSRKNRYHAVS